MIGSIRESGPANQDQKFKKLRSSDQRFHVSIWFFYFRLKARPFRNNKMADAKKKIGGMKRPLVEAYDSDEEDEQKPKIKGDILGNISVVSFEDLSQINYHTGPLRIT